MKALAGESSGSRTIRDGRSVQLPHGADHRVGLDDTTVHQTQTPETPHIVKGGRSHFDAELNMPPPVVTGRTVARQNLGLTGKSVRPPITRLKRERVEMRGQVAGRAGINIVTPDTAQVAALLLNGHIGKAGPLERMKHAQTAKSCADDGHSR